MHYWDDSVKTDVYVFDIVDGHVYRHSEINHFDIARNSLPNNTT